jgi:hypothetical protein
VSEEPTRRAGPDLSHVVWFWAWLTPAQRQEEAERVRALAIANGAPETAARNVGGQKHA